MNNKLFAVELLVHTDMSIFTHGGLKGSGKLQLQRLTMFLIEFYVKLMQFTTLNGQKSHRQLGIGVACDVKLFCSI